MSPEIARAVTENQPEVHYGKSCDVWSLGVIVYMIISGILWSSKHGTDESCAGKPPFEGDFGSMTDLQNEQRLHENTVS